LNFDYVSVNCSFARNYGFAGIDYIQGNKEQTAKYDLSEDYVRLMFADEVEPTNNHSEQPIRHRVIDRRITQGTRGEAGQRKIPTEEQPTQLREPASRRPGESGPGTAGRGFGGELRPGTEGEAFAIGFSSRCGFTFVLLVSLTLCSEWPLVGHNKPTFGFTYG